MKTKMIKFIIPVMAIVFAIAASAFTAVDKVADDAAISEGYVFDATQTPRCQEVNNLDCSLEGDYMCTYKEKPVYQLPGATICSIPLARVTPE